MKYLGLDLGSKTLGVAESDSLGILATSKEVIDHNNDFENLVSQVLEIINRDNINAVVIGYPINMDGSKGERAKLSEEFKSLLSAKIDIPIYLEDERLSTVEAEKELISIDMKRKKRKKVIDKEAASIILQRYLDRRK